ncbi:MAG: acyl carrier protein [Gammaproteobacteria bacterium]|nr:acyl carrier protein [Gammaproteobacteria bacterium]
MNRNLDDLLSIIAPVLGAGAGTLDLDSGLDVTPGWDSLKNMEVLLQVEQLFRVRFTAEELMALHSVRGIHACLRAKSLID